MKRRVIAVLCMLTVLVGILAVTTAAQEEKNTFRVGYAKVDINPWVDPNDWTKGMMEIPLGGYKESYNRLAKGWMDDNGDGVVDQNDGLFATCIAVTDSSDNTVLFISYDSINTFLMTVEAVREQIVVALNGAVSSDEIMLSSSHSHFTPDLGVDTSMLANEAKTTALLEKYKTYLNSQITKAAVAAMKDRAEATAITKSETDASDVTGYTLNGVRHYLITAESPDGSRTETWYAGDNFGTMTDHNKYIAYGPYAGWIVTRVKHVSEANDKLNLLQFSFDDGREPIVMANWRGHTTLNKTGNKTRSNSGAINTLTGDSCVSSDYVNAFRYSLEQKGYRVSFIQGASGNINNTSRDSEVTNNWSTVLENDGLLDDYGSKDDNRGNVFGRLLAKVANEGLKQKNLESCEAEGKVRSMQVRYGLDNHTFGDDLAGLSAAANASEAEGNTSFPYRYVWKTADGGDGKIYVLNSVFHKNAVLTAAKNVKEGFNEVAAKLELNTIKIGEDIAFVSAPGEMYDYYDAADGSNAWLELVAEATYGTPFVLGYTNGRYNYIPRSSAYDYNEDNENFGTGTYGANTAAVAKGSGEKIISEFKKMLNITSDPTTIKTYECEHCDEVVDWKPLILSNNGDKTWYTGHYYLYEDINVNQTRLKEIPSGEQVCLDLNGHTLQTQHQDLGRAFTVNANSVLSIMDTVGGGKVSGHAYLANHNWGGGTVQIFSGGTLNLHSGTIGYHEVENHAPKNGGTIYCLGAFNMEGGTVEGGTATSGGAIYLKDTGDFKMSGGSIIAGTAADGQGDCVYVESGAKIQLSGDACAEELQFAAKSNTMGSALKIKGTYTGTASIRLTSATSGLDVGDAENADISAATLTCANDPSMRVFLSGTDLKLYPGAASINGTFYPSAQQAVNEYTVGTIVLEADCQQGFTVPEGKTVTMDLNGNDLKNVTILGSGKLYVKDSKTDDFTVQDGDYGTITGALSDNVEGVPLTNGVGYLKIKESDNVWSFHKIEMTFKNMVLRPSEAGMYYQCNFLGDERVKENVAQYGVAMSVAGTPSVENGQFTEDCKYSWFTEFNAGSAGNAGSSTLLKGIMKETNGYLVNKRNSAMDVYSRTYIKLTDNTYLLGQNVAFSLQDLMETANLDDVWSSYDDEVDGMVELYKTYKTVMSSWNIPNLKAAEKASEKVGQDNVLKILTLGNSHSGDAMNMLYKIFEDNKVDGKYAGKYDEIVLARIYYSGCPISTHLFYAKNNRAEYQYFKTNDNGDWTEPLGDGAKTTMYYALQDEDWDVVVLQEMNIQAGADSTYTGDKLQQLINYVKANTKGDPILGFNMTWTNPNGEEYWSYGEDGYRATYLGHPGAATADYNAEDWYNSYIGPYGTLADGRTPDQNRMYQKIAELTQTKVMTQAHGFNNQFLFACATAVQYMQDVLKLTEAEVYRDYTHMNDYGRTLAACLWYAKIAELDNIDDLVIMDEIPEALRGSAKKNDIGVSENIYPQDGKITAAMKEKIVEAVNWTLQHPYELPAAK